MTVVTVVSEGGQEIRRYLPHDRLTVAAVLKHLNSRGYVNGDLEDSLGGGLLDDFVLVEGECYTYVERAVDLWFKGHDELPSASSLASSPADIKRFMDGNNPIYDLGRVSAGVPLDLTVEAFGLYSEAFKTRVLDAVDWQFVHDVMDMSGFFSDEKQREATFCDHLEAACPAVRFRFTCSVKGRSIPDITIEAFIAGEWITVGFVEVKLELIGAETCIEVMKYYGDHSKLLWQRRHWTFQSSCCPVLIIELAGPHIRVGGAARYIEKPAYQPFTPLLHIFKFLQDASHLSMLSRALASIGGTIQSLVTFYSSLASSSLQAAQVRGPELEWPVSIRALKQQGATVVQKCRPVESGSLRLMNVARSKELIFGVGLCSSSDQV